MDNPRQAVIDAKAALLVRMPDVAQRMQRLDEWLADEVAAVQAEGADAVPQLAYRDVCNGAVSAAQRQRLQRRGCVIIRNVFDAQQAADWNEAIGRYIDDNDYYRKARDKAGMISISADWRRGVRRFSACIGRCRRSRRGSTKAWT